MKSIRARLKRLFAKDQLVADGGSVWKSPDGHWRKKRILKFGSAGGLTALCLFLTIASIGLPFPGKVAAARAEATEIYAANGDLLYKVRGEKNRTVIAFEQMPECIKKATVAVEDKDFYKHQGLDPRGLGRAVVANVKLGLGSQGGSTITQQLVKNALLTPERTFTRKAKEMVLSLEIEQMFSKDDILAIYLNEIPYGSSAYGIEAASQTYFAKPAKSLTLAQCATLAALPQAPTFYSPYNNPDPERLKNRSKYVLDRMVTEKALTGDESAAAKTEIDKGLEFAAAKGEEIKAPHFVFYVLEQLEKDPQFTQRALQEKGYKVITTLDPGKQQIAQEAIANARPRFPGFGASNAALTSIDPKTGHVLAMVGSVDYFDQANDGNVNVATSERQPGSSFKPFVYLAGFKKATATNLEKPLKFNPATLLWDVKTDFGGGYAPNNYDRTFRGPVSARDALQQSLNVPAVKMLDLVGVNESLDLAHQMGITTLNDPDRYGLSLVLGGGEVKLVDMATAYGVIANQGIAANQVGGKAAPVAITEVKDRKNKSIKRFGNDSKEIVSKALAYQITDVLKDDAARAPQFGRGGPLTIPGWEAGAKTGTTDSFRDAWTFGYTPGLVTGVWLGNNDNSPMNQTGGSLGAAPIWQDYMRRALAQDEARGAAKTFEKPGGIKELKVDRLTGLLPTGGQTKSEIFTEENQPREKSAGSSNNCKVNTSGLHSERPNNPSWENPVQTFIKSRGIRLPGAPKGGENECGPNVTITKPGNGDKVSGTIQIQATATSDIGVKSVEFSWDGRVIGSDDSAPFTTSYTITDTSGTHTIAAKATDDEDNSKTAQISVTVGSEGPATVTLSCTGRTCTANSSAPLTNPVLVNSTATSETVNMTKIAEQTYRATAPDTWTGTFARGTDPGGNTVQSSPKTLALGDLMLLATLGGSTLPPRIVRLF